MTTALLDQPGVRLGHWTDHEAMTGCSVLVFNRPALTAVEVRGAAPGTRELDLLAPGRLVQRVDAILLTGGSAFGLRAADGVVQRLAEQGRGFASPAGPVPIVPAAVIFDLGRGTPISPTADNGSHAFDDAISIARARQGAIGAGRGATFGSVDPAHAQTGGIGIAQHALGGHLLTAIVVLNAFGNVVGAQPDPRAEAAEMAIQPPGIGQSTTLIAVITDAPCTHEVLQRMTISAHDALARMVLPAHTMFDGDVAFASATVEGTSTAMEVLARCMAAELAVESAIRSVVAISDTCGATLRT